MQKISIVTGTLNRAQYLEALVSNTVDANHNIELVLVDGGSNDGTIEYIKNLKHERIKLVEVGGRSSYPHYMNLGIKNASHELICQWNDDVLLYNDWQDVFDSIDEEHDAYLFNWKEGNAESMMNPEWLRCLGMRDNKWIIINNADYPQRIGEGRQEIVMNYGIYKKDVFRKIGLYNTKYKYYCADGEMAMRAYYSGCKFKSLLNIKVCVLPAEKRAIMMHEDVARYGVDCANYIQGNITGEFDLL